MNNVAAIIITYNVGEGFEQRVQNLKDKVEEIIIVDNGSSEKTLKILKKVEELATIIYLDKNNGIAYALNRGIEYALKKHYKWILTLDHDSEVTQDMIMNMLKCYNSLEVENQDKIAMLVPRHIEENDSKDNNRDENLNELYTEVLTEITSGSLTKAEVYSKYGMYDEKLFIDLVDHDYCLDLKQKGLHIIQVNSAILLHNLGETTKKKLLGVQLLPTNHSALRRYYMTRNRFYIWKKYKKIFPKWVLLDKRRFITETIKIILFEENKGEKLNFIKKGILDYRRNKFGEYSE